MRSRLRIGRQVRYFPLSSEVASGAGGESWPAWITFVNKDGSVSLETLSGGSGGVAAKTLVKQTGRAGGFDFRYT